ncbi:MAG: glycosyltransferase [Fibromonadales bacterium]|nr:glycosyltransferase [Fibromonadales bacterium]
MVTPAVSVIIPTYNRPDLLERAVKSVLSQSFSSFEIIVANDAGNSVESLLSELDADRGYIKLVNAAQKSGVSATRNLALNLAQGKYIAYLDDDDYYYPEHLELLHKYLEDSGEKVVYSDSICATQEEQNNVWITVRKEIKFSDEFNSDEILIRNYIPVLNVMHARECLEKSGVFDETLSSHEDWDLWIRMSRHYSFHHIAQVTAEYTYRPVQETEAKRKDYREGFADTREQIYKKYAELVADKPEIQATQQKILEQQRTSRKIASQILPFMQNIKEKLRAGDIQGAWEYYSQHRPAEDSSGAINAELARIDELMRHLPR